MTTSRNCLEKVEQSAESFESLSFPSSWMSFLLLPTTGPYIMGWTVVTSWTWSTLELPSRTQCFYSWFSSHSVTELRGLGPSADLGRYFKTNRLCSEMGVGQPGSQGQLFQPTSWCTQTTHAKLTNRLYITHSTVGFHKVPSSLLRELPFSFAPDCPLHLNIPTDAGAGQTQAFFLPLHICESPCPFPKQPNPRHTLGPWFMETGFFKNPILFFFQTLHSLTSESFGGSTPSGDVVYSSKYRWAHKEGMKLIHISVLLRVSLLSLCFCLLNFPTFRVLHNYIPSMSLWLETGKAFLWPNCCLFMPHTYSINIWVSAYDRHQPRHWESTSFVL